jgi:hypothetical protein
MWTKEQFQAWKASQATKHFLAFLKGRRDELAARWADGEEMTAHDQSMAQVYNDLINLDYGRDVLSTYEETGSEAVQK